MYHKAIVCINDRNENMPEILLMGSIHFHELFHEKEPSQKFLNSLDTLREHLIRYQPTEIFIEKDYDRQTEIDEFYKEYNQDKFYKDESIDIGAYVAKQMKLPRVIAMDRMKSDFDTGGFGQVFERLKKQDAPVMETIETLQREGSDYNPDDVMDALHVNNMPEIIDLNRQLYNELVTVGDSWEDTIPWLTWWSKRNMVMAHHVANQLKDDSRALVIVGSGHIYALEDILKATKRYNVINFNDYFSVQS